MGLFGEAEKNSTNIGFERFVRMLGFGQGVRCQHRQVMD